MVRMLLFQGCGGFQFFSWLTLRIPGDFPVPAGGEEMWMEKADLEIRQGSQKTGGMDVDESPWTCQTRHD